MDTKEHIFKRRVNNLFRIWLLRINIISSSGFSVVSFLHNLVLYLTCVFLNSVTFIYVVTATFNVQCTDLFSFLSSMQLCCVSLMWNRRLVLMWMKIITGVVFISYFKRKEEDYRSMINRVHGMKSTSLSEKDTFLFNEWMNSCVDWNMKWSVGSERSRRIPPQTWDALNQHTLCVSVFSCCDNITCVTTEEGELWLQICKSSWTTATNQAAPCSRLTLPSSSLWVCFLFLLFWLF